MQSRNKNHRHWLMTTLPLAVLLAACGTNAANSFFLSNANPHDPSPNPEPDCGSHPHS